MQDETSGSRMVLRTSEHAPAPQGGAAATPPDAAPPRKLLRHQRITQSGPGAIYYVKSGMIALESRLHMGSRLLIEIYYPGDNFVTTSEPTLQGMAFMALNAAEVLKVSNATFANDIGSDAARLNVVLHHMQMQRARVQLHIAITSRLTSEQRVAALLIELATRLGNWSEQHVTFWLPLTRTDIANYLAINPDTISRIMSRLKAKKLIERTGRSLIQVRDWPGLLAECPLSESVCRVHRPITP